MIDLPKSLREKMGRALDALEAASDEGIADEGARDEAITLLADDEVQAFRAALDDGENDA